MHTTYEPDWTLAQARDRYFVVNHFGTDGGYGDAWVDFKLGPIPMPFPNPPARVRAVRYHDLHHVLTGYDTDTRGEFEISAWEIGAGCKGFVAAWVLNLSGMFAGLLTAPRRTFAAFVRGRRMASLYGEDYDALLATSVAEARRRYTRVDGRAVGLGDLATFALACAAGLAIGAPLFVLMIALLPLGLLAHALRKRAADKGAAQRA